MSLQQTNNQEQHSSCHLLRRLEQNKVWHQLQGQKKETHPADALKFLTTEVDALKSLITEAQESKEKQELSQHLQQDTEETDSEGGTRKITQTDTKKEVIYEENGEQKTLITQSVISPTVEGAIITAEGAGDITVKTNIIQAVSAVTGLSTHKIQVFEMSH